MDSLLKLLKESFFSVQAEGTKGPVLISTGKALEPPVGRLSHRKSWYAATMDEAVPY